MHISETYRISGDNTDVLAAPSRLQSIPFAGSMIVEASSTASTATNNFTLTIELPNGEIPVEANIVPYNGFSATNDVLHNDTEATYVIPIPARAIGGHVLISADETGTAVLFIRVSLSSG